MHGAPHSSPDGSSRLRPLAELLGLTTLLALALWGVGEGRPGVRPLLYGGCTLLFVVVLARLRLAGAARPSGEIGRGRAWAEAAGLTAVLGLAAGITAALVWEPYDELRIPSSWLRLGARELFEAAVQQLPLQLFMLPLCVELLRRPLAGRALASGLFALLHLPNPLLAGASGVAAFGWTGLYQRSGRLLPLLVAHAALAGTSSAVIPERLDWNMRVGHGAQQKSAAFRRLGREEVRAQLRTVTTEDYYARNGGDDAGYVQGLYRDLLGREGSPAEVATWIRKLEQRSRARVARNFVMSSEYREPPHPRKETP